MEERARSVLFLAPEPLRETPTGPARRALKLAEVVAQHCAVTLAAPAPSVSPVGPLRTVETGPLKDQRLGEILSGHDVAVVQTLPSPRQLLAVRRRVPRLVVDLIAPLALEAWETGEEGGERRAVVRWRTREMLAHLALADLVLCSNERQRDLLVGAALAAGLIEPGEEDPLPGRIAVVPHGLDERPSRATRGGLRTDGLGGEGDRILVWAGGLWSWLDPFTAIAAVERLRPERPDLKLAFVGFEHPDPARRAEDRSLAEQAAAYVRDRGLEEAVIFRPRWLAREEFVGHLADADAGLSLHGTTLEARYASRTRVLDYLEAGLPVVCTSGDTMSDLVARHGLGWVVEPGDVRGVARALDTITSGERAELDRDALRPLLWENVARPLVDFCTGSGDHRRGGRSALAVAASEYPAFLRAIYRSEGAGELGRATLRRLRRLVDHGQAVRPPPRRP